MEICVCARMRICVRACVCLKINEVIEIYT